MFSLVKHGGSPTAEVKMLLPTLNNVFKMQTLYLEKYIRISLIQLLQG